MATNSEKLDQIIKGIDRLENGIKITSNHIMNEIGAIAVCLDHTNKADNVKLQAVLDKITENAPRLDLNNEQYSNPTTFEFAEHWADEDDGPVVHSIRTKTIPTYTKQWGTTTEFWITDGLRDAVMDGLENLDFDDPHSHGLNDMLIWAYKEFQDADDIVMRDALCGLLYVPEFADVLESLGYRLDGRTINRWNDNPS